jgi:hypothetical protein
MEHFLQELRQMLWSNLYVGFLSGVSDSIVLPTRVNLLLQRDDVAGQPVGSHTDSSQVMLFQEINLIG